MKPIRVFNPNIDLLAEISNYESLFFARSWYGIGDLELRINRYKKYTDTLQKGNVIVMGNDKHKAYQILHREIELDQNGKATENWLIKALQLKSVTGQRITMSPSNTAYDNKQGDAESVMKHYVSNHLVNPVAVNRKIEQLILADNLNRGSHISWQSRFKNVAEELQAISLLSELGWNISVDYQTKKWIFDVLEGRDLSANNTAGNNPVIFSPEFGNIQTMQFSDSDLNYKNTAYVAGQGEGIDRRVIELGESTGLARHEMFVDARDVAEEINEQPRPEHDIVNDLTVRGQQILAERITEQFLEGQIITSAKYKKDLREVSGSKKEMQLDIEKQYLEFDGNNDYVDLGNAPELGFTTDDDFTFSATLMSLRVTGNNLRLFSNGNNSNGGFEIFADDNVVLRTYDGMGTFYTFNGPSIDYGEWVNISIVKKGNVVNFYKNGELTHSPENIRIAKSTTNAYIGKYNANDLYNFVGKISEISVYNRALNDIEIQTNLGKTLINDGLVGLWGFNDGSGNTLEDSIGNNDGIIQGSAIWGIDYKKEQVFNAEPIDLSNLGKYRSSRFLQNLTTPTGTSIIIEYSFDNENWQELGETLPFQEGHNLEGLTLYIRCILTTNNNAITPTLDIEYIIMGYVLSNNKVITTGPFEYENDWDLGDIVTLQNKDWGVTMNARITGITEIYEVGGFRLEATFGKNRPTLIQKIKQELSQISGEVRK